MSGNANLHNAKSAKNDEFYTQLTDIEKEMSHYKDFFKGKVVYCNCDDARESNFFKYFSMNFEHLGLKKLITTGYKEDGKGVIYVYEGDKNGNREVDDDEVIVTELEGNGDFKSDECIEYLKEADVVVTNPPFSLFREYVKQLMDYDKKFIIIGNKNAITYKETFTLIKENRMWLGYTSPSAFIQPEDDKPKAMQGLTRWFTNLPHNKRKEELYLGGTYYEGNPLYPKYDNYDAIEVSKVKDIPYNYDGVMGVPITFLDKYNPTQFEIVGLMSGAKGEEFTNGNDGRLKFYVDGKGVYARILIRKCV